jgi:hypothetical protein
MCCRIHRGKMWYVLDGIHMEWCGMCAMWPGFGGWWCGIGWSAVVYMRHRIHRGIMWYVC